MCEDLWRWQSSHPDGFDDDDVWIDIEVTPPPSPRLNDEAIIAETKETVVADDGDEEESSAAALA